MYRDTPFSMESLVQVEKDLREARSLYSSAMRIFLVNGDAFELSFSRLKTIAQKVIEYFPEVETITMYSSISNVKSKTDEELAAFRRLKINELWIGVDLQDDVPQAFPVLLQFAKLFCECMVGFAGYDFLYFPESVNPLHVMKRDNALPFSPDDIQGRFDGTTINTGIIFVYH